MLIYGVVATSFCGVDGKIWEFSDAGHMYKYQGKLKNRETKNNEKSNLCVKCDTGYRAHWLRRSGSIRCKSGR